MANVVIESGKKVYAALTLSEKIAVKTYWFDPTLGALKGTLFKIGSATGLNAVNRSNSEVIIEQLKLISVSGLTDIAKEKMEAKLRIVRRVRNHPHTITNHKTKHKKGGANG